MHKRGRPRARRLLRTPDGEPRAPSRRRAARRRRLELRGAEERSLVVPHDDLCSGGAARIRARRRVHEEIAAARRRGEEYLSARGLFRRRSTGEVANPAFLEFAFPCRYHYDVLRALDHLRNAGVGPDARFAGAVGLVEARGRPTAAGSSIARTMRRSTFPSASRWASRVGGTRSGRCVCSVGTSEVVARAKARPGYEPRRWSAATQALSGRLGIASRVLRYAVRAPCRGRGAMKRPRRRLRNTTVPSATSARWHSGRVLASPPSCNHIHCSRRSPRCSSLRHRRRSGLPESTPGTAVHPRAAVLGSGVGRDAAVARGPRGDELREVDGAPAAREVVARSRREAGDRLVSGRSCCCRS